MGAIIKDSRAIVTGGAKGLGYMYVRHLLLKGANTVAILDVDIAIGTEVTKKLNIEFGLNRVLFIPTDVSKPDLFEASFKRAVESLGGLDIMINNAGIMNESKWDLMIDINIKGVIKGTLMAIDVMGKHKGGEGGTIINIGSTAAFLSEKYVSIYIATKSAVVAFSRGISLTFKETGVAIKTMCPGAADTPLMTSESHRFLDFFNQEEAVKFMQGWALQTPEMMAKEVMRLIEEASNGDVWVNMLELPTMSLKIPDFTTWGTPV